MGEFITTCPKCRQRIMGDTHLIGLRAVCPICMQEMVLPSPPALEQNPPGEMPKKKSGLSTVLVVSAMTISILAAGLIWVWGNSSPTLPSSEIVSFNFGDDGIPTNGRAGVVPATFWNHSHNPNGAGLFNNSGVATTVTYSLITKLAWGLWSVSSF